MAASKSAQENQRALRSFTTSLERQGVNLQRLTIGEVEGSDPISITLKGGAMVEVGASFGVKSLGGKSTPLGASYSILAVTGVDFPDTTMKLALDAPFLRSSDAVATGGATMTLSPEGIVETLQKLVLRGRLCNVELGPFARLGILREITPTPNRGYLVDPQTGRLAGRAGVNIELELRWEWAGQGIPQTPGAVTPSTAELGLDLSRAEASISAALATDAFAPGLLESLGDGLGNIRKGVSDVRKAIKGVGDLASAPARIANQAIATARALGNVVNAFHETLSDVGDEYAAAKAGAAGLLASRRAKGAAKAGADAMLAAVTSVLDALERRRPLLVGVRPGQSLVDVAVKHLGSGDRWGEIASRNEIGGQVVPSGVFSVEVPGA